jgi:uncharacterized protein YeaC (DUF1315 family)
MDRTTKALLAAIALGLWANAIPKGQAQSDQVMQRVMQATEATASYLGVIAFGNCQNTKLCGK